MSTKSKLSSTKSSFNLKPTWFDNLSSVKKDIFSIAVLFVLLYILFFKIITSDMMFADSGDTASVRSWDKAMEHIRTTEKVDPFWIPYIFSGLPVASAMIFSRDLNYPEIILLFIGKPLFFGGEMSWFILHYFLMGIFTYFLARQLKFLHLPSLFAAITMMLNPYAIGLAQSGHGSKMMTLTFVPLVFLLAVSLFQRRDILSLGLLGAATGTMLLNKHPQIALYGLLLIGIYFLYESILDIKTQPVIVAKRFALFAAAMAIGFAIFTYQYFPTEQYKPHSIRGSLTYEYATSWSNHPLEMLTFIHPSFFGFSNNYITEIQGAEQALPLYWGWMPFVEGPVYVGIIPALLMVFAFIYKRNRLTWFLTIFTIFILFLSFGNHLGLIYNLFFDYLPYFNSLRAPAMILSLVSLTCGLIAAFGVSFLMELHQRGKEIDLEKINKNILKWIAIIGAVIVFSLVGKSFLQSFLSDFMFSKEGELREFIQQAGQQGALQYQTLLKEKRFDVFWGDMIKMFVLSGALLGLIYFYIKGRKSPTLAAAGMILLVTVDLAAVDVKFVNPRPRTSFEEPQADATVQYLNNDSSLYRIFPLGRDGSGQDLFQNNSFMYHQLSSIGGYSPAKIRIYQDLIESALYNGADPQFPINMNVVNMLNVKYLIAPGQLPANKFQMVNFDQTKKMLTYINPGCLPRAWFVDTAIVASSKNAVFLHLNSPDWNPHKTAILETALPSAILKSDSTRVSDIQYQSQKLSMKVFTAQSALLVVSEIYYPPGWKAFIDGNTVEIYKTNYVLRSLIIPAGEHTVEFRFDASIYETGLAITNAGWGISLLLVLVGLIQIPAIKKRIGLGKKIQITDNKSV
ncbi:MAG: YfhO family protein [Ignavibacteriales bacterium]|nr:YfhO family protein [Ignavibacteriales bacterium]